jgi:hypothetical protein
MGRQISVIVASSVICSRNIIAFSLASLKEISGQAPRLRRNTLSLRVSFNLYNLELFALISI